MAEVDEIWAEMQREAAPKASRRPVAKVVDLSKLQREKQRPKGPVAKKQLDSSLNWMSSWSTTLKKQDDIGNLPGADDAGSIRMMEPPATLIDAVDEIPTETPETFLAYLQRDINCLGEDQLGVRLQSLQKMERLLVKRIDNLSTDIVDAAADATLKPLLKRMKDKSEKCRELAVKILRSLVENSSDLSVMLPYIFPTLVARLGCEDLDGIAHLPEAMRPDPEQKPTEIARPVEDSEEVRLELGHFVAMLLARCNQGQIYSYIDEATGLLRAQAMDPFHEVKALACETMISFCHNHTEMLLHFAEPMGRSLTSCLTHNHAKIRIAALRAIVAVFYCGVWKHNFEVLQILIAWQDENKVPIKAFYEPVTSVNYLSTLSFDRHPAVRRFFFETLAYILLRIPDKCDHEPYLFPYLLTGLCDENEEIALETFWLIERCGELYEQEHEEDLRKTKQYGFDYGWTYGGRAFIPFPLRGVWGGGGLISSVRFTAAHGPDLLGETDLPEHLTRDRRNGEDLGEEVAIPARDYAWSEFRDLAVYRILPRPRLGSRSWVRTHTRRYIKATFNDVVDFRDCTALNAGRLLCMSLAYTEEGVTEWLQPMTAALVKFYSGRAWACGDSRVMKTFDTVCKLLGAFLDPISWWEQMKDALDPQCTTLDTEQRIATVRVLALCLEGAIETLQTVQPPDPTLGMGRLTKVIPDLISCMHASDLLLSPTNASREVLWNLTFSFLEPFRAHLSVAQVSQLLFVALALGAKAPPDASSELTVETPQFEEEELVDSEKLQRALAALSNGVGAAPEAASGFSLDSLDDDEPAPAVEASADPRVVHQPLFQLAFAEVLARLDDSFQVFRSVLYLTPLSVLTSTEHASAVLERLSGFCGPSATTPTRCAGQALGVHLLLRCGRLLAEAPPSSAAAVEAGAFLWRLFQLSAQALLDASSVKTLSYNVIVSSLSLWRRLFLCPCMDPRLLLFPPKEAGASASLEWLTSLVADQELYKKFHKALEHAETATSGREKDGFVVEQSRRIREESELRANKVRGLASSTLLLALRRMLQEQGGAAIPWAGSSRPGSLRQVVKAATSLFSPAPHTMDPPFVKPTPAFMLLYGSELLRVLFHQVPGASPEPFQLLDDAARAIHQIAAPATAPRLAFALEAAEGEALAGDFISALIGLNLTLPPDPQAKYAPASLDEAADAVILGWDEALASAPADASRAAVPHEVTRLLAQSSDCLRWNAALSLYMLGVDLSVVCQEGFQSKMMTWRQRKEQSRLLIASDLLDRSKRILGR
mmetsp:Transcript_52749/g.112873  ORF Transcript_52749/g.112873 Transcript_52749/m.112873 type:complete len:1279 (-) Transcript_52749:88-3924(-)